MHVGFWKDFHYPERVILCQYGTLSWQIWARAFWHMDLSVSHQQDPKFLSCLSLLLHILGCDYFLTYTIVIPLNRIGVMAFLLS